MYVDIVSAHRQTSVLSHRQRALARLRAPSSPTSPPGSDNSSPCSNANARVATSPSLTVLRRRSRRDCSTTSPNPYGRLIPLTTRPRSRGTIEKPGLTGDSPIWNPPPRVATGLGTGGAAGYIDVCARECCERRRNGLCGSGDKVIEGSG